MRVSISITDYTWPEGPPVIPQRLREVSMAADDVGVDTVWVADHLVQADPTVPDDTEMLEAFTTLGHLAGAHRPGCGSAPWSPPRPSARRPCWSRPSPRSTSCPRDGPGSASAPATRRTEAAAMGLPMPSVAERFEHLEDLLRLARQMWSGDLAPFHGARHHLARPDVHRAGHQPHPPILVGGTGEKRTLRLVAEHADACNLFDIPGRRADRRAQLAVLARHCEEVGRPRTEIETTLSTGSAASQRLTSSRTAPTWQASVSTTSSSLTAGPWTGTSVAGPGRHRQGPGGRARRWVVIQFVAQVSPPSRENACSNRGSTASANQE